MGINTLIINKIHSQQNLNKPKGKLRNRTRTIVDFSFGEWFVEKMLSRYGFVYEHITSTIHQSTNFHQH